MELDLQSLHKQKREAQVSQPKQAQPTSSKSSTSAFADPLAAGIQSLSKTCAESLRASNKAIFEALVAMGNSTATSHAEEQLLLAETGLASNSAALKQTLKTLSEMEPSILKRNDQFQDSMKHYKNLLVILVDRVSQERIAVGICREECAAYNAELKRHLKCGVLCAPSDARPKGAVGTSTMAELENKPFLAHKGKGKSDSVAKNPLAAAGGVKAVTRNPSGGKFHQQRQLDDDNDDVDVEADIERKASVASASRAGSGLAQRVMSAAVHKFHVQASAVSNLTVKFADETARLLTSHSHPSQTDEQRTGGDPELASSSNRPRSNAPVGAKAIAQQALEAYEMPEAYHFSDAEKAAFEKQGEQLLQRQHTLEAQSAKEVELGVMQLSQLNALVSEHVFAQAEQIAMLERNTEESRTAIRKAASELEKPLERKWNGTRMFIVFVWINIVVLYLSHWVIR